MVKFIDTVLLSALPALCFAGPLDIKKIDALLRHVKHRAKIMKKHQSHRNVATRGLIELFTMQAAVNNYGCWCHFNPGDTPGGDPVDNVDAMCQQWHQSKTCITSELGSSTCTGAYNDVLTSIQNPFNSATDLVAACDAANPSDQCHSQNCAADSSFMRDLYNFLAYNNLNTSNSVSMGEFDTTNCVGAPTGDACCNSYHKDPCSTAPVVSDTQDTRLINDDGTIRAFGASSDFCLVNVDDVLINKDCSDIPRWRANNFELTLEGKIRRTGSTRCWLAPSLTRPLQKIKIRNCDGTSRSNDFEARQRFVDIGGRIHLDANQNLCAAVDEQDGTIVLKTCFGDNWTIDDTGSDILQQDRTIRPFEYNTTCIHYYAWLPAGAELFLGSCADSEHQNVNRADKYKWVIDGGNIKSMKDNRYCMTIDAANDKKQRVVLHLCDGSNDQLFTIESGMIRNGNLCAQYSIEELQSDRTPLVFQSCQPSLFARRRINNQAALLEHIGLVNK